jgi:prepilin-type N-terminal cleavage/methylation domain-containing protein
MNNKDGFTIIELMIGAAIVGIMAAVVFQAATGNSYKQQCMDSGGQWSEGIQFGRYTAFCTHAPLK